MVESVRAEAHADRQESPASGDRRGRKHLTESLDTGHSCRPLCCGSPWLRPDATFPYRRPEQSEHSPEGSLLRWQRAARCGVFRLLHLRLLPENVSVLMYHGLVGAPLPVPDWCFLPLSQFEEQMEYLARHCDVVHLEEAFSSDSRGAGRPRACVTFDDGFASVHDLALPVLERLGIPATVYLVTDLVDSATRSGLLASTRRFATKASRR
jgi:hypothetical protein